MAGRLVFRGRLRMHRGGGEIVRLGFVRWRMVKAGYRIGCSRRRWTEMVVDEGMGCESTEEQWSWR